jgi:voltage-gated potassium channel
MLVRPLVTVVLSLAAYFWLPLPSRSDPVTIVLLAVGLTALVIVVVWHVREIATSDYPRMRAIEALAIALPMYLLLFAATYFVLARSSATNFSEALSRADALYFTVTVFSTTGFGDITPHSGDARMLVTGQMIGNMIFLGFGIRQLATATQIGLSRRSTVRSDPSTSVDPTPEPQTRSG